MRRQGVVKPKVTYNEAMAKDKARALERWTGILVMILTLAGLGIIWTVFLTSTLGEKLKNSNRESEALQREARIFASSLSQVLEDSRLGLEAVATYVETHRDKNLLNDPGLLALARVFQKGNQMIGDLRLADRAGKLFILDGKLNVNVSVADRDYFRVQKPYPGAGFFIDRPVISRVSQWWTLVLSEALVPNAGELSVVMASLEFSRLDNLVNSFTETRGDTIRTYRSDGALLYEYPLEAGFPRIAEGNPLKAMAATGTTAGTLPGNPLRAFQRLEDSGLWVVIDRPASTRTGESEWWFWEQLLWVCLLTGVILTAAIGLVVLLARLKAIRLAQAELARIDPLTGLVNRRAFLERCSQERSRVERQKGPLSLALLDLDHFKEVNDRFGHQAGDQALRDFAKALVRTMRSTDALARTGGEEFAVLMPGTDGKTALEIAERIRAEVSTIALTEGRLTTSIGVAPWDGIESFEGWYHRADQALYRAKNSGRNRVELAAPPLA